MMKKGMTVFKATVVFLYPLWCLPLYTLINHLRFASYELRALGVLCAGLYLGIYLFLFNHLVPSDRKRIAWIHVMVFAIFTPLFYMLPRWMKDYDFYNSTRFYQWYFYLLILGGCALSQLLNQKVKASHRFQWIVLMLLPGLGTGLMSLTLKYDSTGVNAFLNYAACILFGMLLGLYASNLIRMPSKVSLSVSGLHLGLLFIVLMGMRDLFISYYAYTFYLALWGGVSLGACVYTLLKAVLQRHLKMPHTSKGEET